MFLLAIGATSAPSEYCRYGGNVGPPLLAKDHVGILCIDVGVSSFDDYVLGCDLLLHV